MPERKRRRAARSSCSSRQKRRRAPAAPRSVRAARDQQVSRLCGGRWRRCDDTAAHILLTSTCSRNSYMYDSAANRQEARTPFKQASPTTSTYMYYKVAEYIHILTPFILCWPNRNPLNPGYFWVRHESRALTLGNKKTSMV